MKRVVILFLFVLGSCFSSFRVVSRLIEASDKFENRFFVFFGFSSLFASVRCLVVGQIIFFELCCRLISKGKGLCWD